MNPLLLMLPLILACRNEPDPVDTGPWRETDPPGDSEPWVDETPWVLINELMAHNEGSVPDGQGGAPDWIELYNAESRAVDLSGFTMSDDWTDKGKATFYEGTTIEPGGWLLLWADGLEQPGHLPFELDAGGEGVGLFARDGTVLDWVTYPAMRADYVRARIPDGVSNWQAMPHGTPEAANYWVERSTGSLVPKGATWRYLDSGEYPGPSWTQASFDDSAWASGPAPLGYGDYQITQVGYGDDEAARHPTTWFRHAFEVPAGTAQAIDAATLALRVDDGAVVWLNGQEIQRQGLGEGEVGPDTWAEASVYGEAEEDYTEYPLEPTLLLDGTNQLAIEVHQHSPSSEDLTLDLELTTTTWVVLD
jgi:hypothetical protein